MCHLLQVPTLFIGPLATEFLLQTSLNYSSLPAMAQSAVKELESDSLQTLAQASVGCDFRIRFLDGPACEQLRRLGFCETLKVRKVSHGRNLVCTVCGTRLALSRELAHHVKVSPLPAA
jgi:ferrous iron transport protein A